MIVSPTIPALSLRSLREAANLSLGKLALLSGVNKSTISRWEGGRTKPRHTASERGERHHGGCSESSKRHTRKSLPGNVVRVEELYLPTLAIEAKMFPLLSRSAKAVQVFADSRSLRLLITDRQAVFVPVIRKEAESTEAVSKESEICSIISERSLRAGRHNNNGTYFRFFT